MSTKVNKIYGFHSPEANGGCFSNWFPAGFELGNHEYYCVEQYMMVRKVLLAKEYALADKIMSTKDPAKMKEYAGPEYFKTYESVRDRWEAIRRHVVKQGVTAKFRCDILRQEALLNTGNALLAECAADDTIWGNGLSIKNRAWKDARNWKGDNYLGQVLMEVREELRLENVLNGYVEDQNYIDAKPIPEWKMYPAQLERMPQYHAAIRAYADSLPDDTYREGFYRVTLSELENIMRTNMGGGLPAAGFYELKQDVYEIAARENALLKKQHLEFIHIQMR